MAISKFVPGCKRREKRKNEKRDAMDTWPVMAWLLKRPDRIAWLAQQIASILA